MKKILNISLVAVLAATPLVAHADIASTGYVTNRINALDSEKYVSTSGKFLTGIKIADGKIDSVTEGAPAAPNDATLTIQRNGTDVGTFTANASAPKIINIVDNDTTYSTGNTTTAGLTKLYTGTGTAEDGTMTQKAIKAELDKKVTANASITAGTGTKITYDAKGLVTGSVSLGAADIPSLTSDKISDFESKVDEMIEDGLTVMNTDVTGLKTRMTAAETDINRLGTNKQDADTAVKHTSGIAVGSATVPVYIDTDGTAKAITNYEGKATTAGTADTVVNNAITSAKIKDGEVKTDDIADGAVTMAKTELPAKDKYANVSGVLTKQTSTVKDGRYTLVMNKKGSTITYDWEFIDGESAY